MFILHCITLPLPPGLEVTCSCKALYSVLCYLEPLHHDSLQVVNVPSFIVHIDFSLKSPFGGGRPGHVKRKNAKKGDDAGEEEAKD